MDMSKIELVTVPTSRSRRATGILVTLAMLDVVSYFIHCLGVLRIVSLDYILASVIMTGRSNRDSRHSLVHDKKWLSLTTKFGFAHH